MDTTTIYPRTLIGFTRKYESGYGGTKISRISCLFMEIFPNNEIWRYLTIEGRDNTISLV
jgi:hypothetical protein